MQWLYRVKLFFHKVLFIINTPARRSMADAQNSDDAEGLFTDALFELVVFRLNFPHFFLFFIGTSQRMCTTHYTFQRNVSTAVRGADCIQLHKVP